MTENCKYQLPLASPLSPTTASPSDAPGTAAWTILCDFDGTISTVDVTDLLLEEFGQPGCEELEAAWQQGHIGSRHCLHGQIALLVATRPQLEACLDRVSIDAAFPAFVQQARHAGLALQVVSDGLDYAIQRTLRRHGLALPVRANHLLQRGAQRWTLEFPHASAGCDSGHCKCACLRRERQQGRKILFIGDGTSDFCAAGKADLVLAKDALLAHCRRAHLPHLPIRDFADALTLLPDILAMLHRQRQN